MKSIFKKHISTALVLTALVTFCGCAKSDAESSSSLQTSASISTESTSPQAAASSSAENLVSSVQSTLSSSAESTEPTQTTASSSAERPVSSSDILETTSGVDSEIIGDITDGGNADKIILVGDSRVEIMAIDQRFGNMDRDSGGYYCGMFGGSLTGDYVLAQGGALFDWMDENIYKIDDWIDEGTAIVIAMGINGCERQSGSESLEEFVERYSDLYGSWIIQKSKEWKKKGAVTYFVSVNPVDEVCTSSWGYRMKNVDIEAFNKRMKKIMGENGIGYIDTYSEVYDWVTKLHETCGYYQSGAYKGKLLSDGLHYDQSEIANKIWKVVKGETPVV